MLDTILLFSFFLLIFSLYLYWRNERIYIFRKKLLKEYYETYSKLPSYAEMLIKYWYILDLNKFKEI